MSASVQPSGAGSSPAADSEPRAGSPVLVERLGTHLGALALVAWTLFVWGGRLRNLWLDPGGLTGADRWSLGASVGFVVLAVALAIAVVAGAVAGAAGRWILGLLAGLGIGVWLVRGVDIALGDHSPGFIAVHLLLAGVTIGLSVWAWRVTPRYPPGDG